MDDSQVDIETAVDGSTGERSCVEGEPNAELAEQDVFGAAGEGDVDFHTLTWPHAAVLISKVQIGTGILGIPSTFDTLGFVPGLISLIIICSITTYGGLLVTKMRLIHPELHSPSDLGKILCGGNRYFAGVFAFLYWVLLVMVCSAGILSTVLALNAVSLHAICTVAFTGIVAAATILVGGGMRQLMKVAWLSWVGVISVIASVWILVIVMLTKTYPLGELGQTGTVNRNVVGNSDFASAVSACNTQIFAILGSVTFSSISAEMKKPRDFAKAVWWGQGFVISQYIIIGVIVYAKAGQYVTSPALGSAGVLFKRICYGLVIPASFISSIIYSHMAAKQMFVAVLRGSRHLTKPTLIHWAVWLSFSVFVTVLALILAAAIPLFNPLLSVIGSTVGSLFAIMVAGYTSLYILGVSDDIEVKIHQKEHDDEENSDSSQVPKPSKELQHRKAFQAVRNDWLSASYRAAFTSERRTWKQKDNFFAGQFIVAAGAFLLVGGTYGSVVGIIDAYSSGAIAGPFSCADNSNST